MKRRGTKLLAMLLALMMVISLLPGAALAEDTVAITGHVVISQAYGGGGNSGAKYKNDFVELYNPTANEVTLDGWSVQYASATGSFNNVTELSGKIKSNSYYLIQMAAGTGGTDDLPTPDCTGTAAMSGTKFKLALVNDKDKITGKTDENVVDFLGVGTVDEYEGTAAAPQLSNKTAACRIVSGVDTDDNKADFAAVDPNPRNSGAAVDPPVPTDTPAPTAPPVSDVSTIAEAKAGATGASFTVEGVVNYISSRNVYIEDGTGAIDLYLAAADSSIKIGDLIKATGTRAVYNNLQELAVADGGYKIMSSGNAQRLSNVTVAGLLADTTAYNHQCGRVKLSGVTLGAVNNSGNTALTDAEGHSINVYKIPALTDISEGDTVNVIGVVGIFKNVPQLYVISAADVTKPAVIPDPITEIPEGAVSIVDAIAAADDTNVTVVGQLVYRYGNYDNMNSAIIEDVVNGEIVALQVYNALSDFDIGDVLKVTGKRAVYGGVPQITGVTAVELEDASTAERIPAIEFATLADAKAASGTNLSAWIMIRDVKLGEYNSNGSTVVTDKNSSASTMNIYRAATYPAGVAAGDVVNLYACLSKYNTSTQLRVGSSRDYVVLNDMKAPVITLPDSIPEAEIGKDYVLTFEVEDNVGITALTAEYSLNNKDFTELDAPVLNSGTGKYSVTVPGSAISAGSTTLYIKISARDAVGNSSDKTAGAVISDLPQITDVTPAANSATGAEKRPVISVTYANAGEKPEVAFYLNGGDEIKATVINGSASYTPNDDLADGKYTVRAVITRADRKSCEKTWSFTVGTPAYQLYFGQLHSHTAEYSDGTGTLEDAYDWVLGLDESENVDYLIVTDHSNYFDTKDAASTDINDHAAGTGKWAQAKATADSYAEKAAKAGKLFLYGYEMTWSGGPGHMNTFNTKGFLSRNNDAYTSKSTEKMLAYYDVLAATAQPEIENSHVLAMFNHPGTTFGNFDNFTGYNPARDEIINLLEVGNGEGAVGGSSYWPSYEQYTLALDKGWHVAPANSQDNHKGKWGNANTARTVIATDDFSSAGIYDAIYERSVYSTEDKNLEIWYYLNDYMMGSTRKIEDSSVNITASIADPDGESLGNVSVIVNGGVTAWSQSYTGSTADIDIDLPNDYTYYFLRVDQADGDIAVTAPVWTSDVLKIGITSLTSDAVVPVKGEEITFTTKLFNYENSDMAIQKIVYSMDGFEDAAGYTVAANGELDVTHKFAPVKVGRQTMTVTVYAKLDSVDYVFTSDLELDVLDPSELLNIAIDAGHSNFYVSGNYAASDANFIELCAKNGVRCHRITDDISYEAIKDMEMVVLTVPFKSFGTELGAENLYTADELAALKRYADEGGCFIVCSKSDRGDPEAANEKASVITNGILEAIGAKARIAESIVVDNVKKANEAYRISFLDDENYNYSNPFAAGVKETTNNTFSCYNGAPVIANGADKIVTGCAASTWGSSYTKYFGDSSAYVPVYETDMVVPTGSVDIMVSETLPGGGWCITSGVTFFSTFEVKVEVENAGTLQNSNYQIVMNIIESLLPEPAVTPIADVWTSYKTDGEGAKRFTIEGTVTSNASGYDKDTAFFDCIYLQDATAGINAFPVDGSFKLGDVVRITGVTSSYNGEAQMAVSSIEKIGENAAVEPKAVTALEAMSADNTGSLLKVSGTVDKLDYANGVLEGIHVKDSTGTAYVFIDGYIMSAYTGLDGIKVGDNVSAVGLGSVTVDTSSAAPQNIARLRVRDRSEITFSEGTTPIIIIPDTIKDVDPPKPDTPFPFTDVPEKDCWFRHDVEYAWRAGFIDGMTDTEYFPDLTLTLAQCIKLAACLHQYYTDGKVTLTDGSPMWYDSYVKYCLDNGILKAGYTAEEYASAPSRALVAEVFVTALPEGALKDRNTIPENSIPDVKTGDKYAEAVYKLFRAGIFEGNDDYGTFAPDTPILRSHIAAIIARLLSAENRVDAPSKLGMA